MKVTANLTVRGPVTADDHRWLEELLSHFQNLFENDLINSVTFVADLRGEIKIEAIK